jgi:hypothetical protein
MTNNKGYIYLYRPKHPYATQTGYVKRSRLVMEKHLNRLLNPNERIHHINEIKNDDRIENLRLFESQGKHTKFHIDKHKESGKPFYKHSEETKKKISLAKKGQKPWITGKHHTKETIKKISKSLMRHPPPKTAFKKGFTPWNKGKRIKSNTGQTHFKKGHIPWNKGKELPLEYRRKLSEAHKKKPHQDLGKRR